MLKIPLYFRRFGVRRPTQIMAPRLFPLHTEQLPRNAVLHYLAESRTETGPRSDSILLSKTKKVNYIIHVTEFTSDEGNPRPTFKLPAPMIMDYRRKNRKIRPVSKIENAVRDPQSVLIINYSILPHTRKYNRNRLAAYYEWKNLQATIYGSMAGMLGIDLGEIPPRNQFIEIRMPDKLPGIGLFRQGSNGMPKRVLDEFNTNEALTLLDLWRWVGPSPESSLLSEYISQEDLSRVYFIFRGRANWLVVNLGIIDSWIAREDREGSGGADPLTFQLRFYKFLSRFYETDIVAVDDDEDDDIVAVADDDSPDTPEEAVLKVPKVPVKTRVTSTPTKDTVDPSEAAEELVEDEEEFDEDVDMAKELSLLDEMDADLVSATMDEIEDAEEQELDEDLDDVVDIEEPYDDDEDDAYMDEQEALIARNGIVGGSDDVPSGKVVLERAVVSKALELAEQKIITVPQLRRLEQAAEQYKTMENPFNPKETVAEAIKVPKKKLLIKPDKVPDMVEVIDKSLLESTVEASNRHYIEEVLESDILNSVMAVQQSPVAVTNFETEKVKDAVSDYTVGRVTLLPVTGKPSRLEFRYPNVQPNGVFISNGTKYRMRPQRVDLPIVKINESRVALSTDYGKFMVELSTKARNDYSKWVGDMMVAIATDDVNPMITDARVVNVAVNNRNIPRVYDFIARRLASFTSNGYKYQFDYESRDFDPTVLKRLERGGKQVVVGNKGKSYVVVDKDDQFYYTDMEGNLESAGSVETLFGIAARPPLPMVELKIFGKAIPVGFALAYLWGLDRFLRHIGAKPRRVAVGERLNLDRDEYPIAFKDETLIFDRSDYRVALFMSGFEAYRNHIRQYNYGEFNRKAVYGAVLEQASIPLRYVRELDLMDSMFISPIARDLLEWMREPTEFRPLLIRAVDMLLLPHVPKELEGADDVVTNLERTRGYERFAGVIYNELVKSMRQYNTRNITNNSTISMNPHAVWTRIVTDGATSVVNELNPVENMKEVEVLTYGGDGGRSKRAMVASTRLYKDTDIGAVSEATVDSGDVGVIVYRPPNPTETSVRGTVRAFKNGEDGPSSLFSTSALLQPGSDRDDPKRAMLSAVQQSHVVAAKGYRASPLRTGYENVIAHRVDGLFANVAKQPGKVAKVTDTAITVSYKDGTNVSFPLGREFGVSVGTVIPHTLSTTLKEGDKVKEGDVLTFNEGYFEPSVYTKGQVAWKNGLTATIAIMESSYTIEDSSAISMELAERLSTSVSKKEPVVMRFDQSVSNLVRVGDKVDLDTPLCIIEDDFISRGKLFSDLSEEQLRYMQAEIPRAGVVGTVERVEVFYHGDTDDMSESLRSIALASDKRRKAMAKELGADYTSGKVDQSLRIRGEGLELNQACIFVYITYNEAMGVGDQLGLPAVERLQ